MGWTSTATGERVCCPTRGWHLFHAHSEIDPKIPLESRLEWACVAPLDTGKFIGYSNNECSKLIEASVQDVGKSESYNQNCTGNGTATLYRSTKSAHDILSPNLWKDI